MNITKVTAFLIESNRIEGIHSGPTDTEKATFERFMHLPAIGLQDVNDLQAAFAPGQPLRDRVGLNVRVGSYIAPAGGPIIREHLQGVIASANTNTESPWRVHVRFEVLHPYCDGNGRTGRMLWAWHMRASGRDPFALPFLHRFYYQTLEAQG